jgi:DNA-binding SARP family transcriptional activator
MDFLGPLEAVEDGQLLPLGGMKQRTVLALLIAHGGRPISTDALIDGVYGEVAPSGARRSVQTYVSNLRRQLGDVIKPTGSGYVLGVPAEAVDAVRFDRLVSEAADLEEPGAAADRLRAALAIWRRHPYDDVDGFGAIPSEVSRLNELRLVAVERRVEADLDAGKHGEVIGELESLTADYPFRERFHGQHMLALA